MSAVHVAVCCASGSECSEELSVMCCVYTSNWCVSECSPKISQK